MLCCRSSDGTVFASSAAAAAHAQATARAETHTAHHQSDSDTAPVHATSCVTCMACCVACLGLLVWSAITIAQGSLRPVSTETVLPELSGYEGPYRPPRHILG
jgi:hypothetical protein